MALIECPECGREVSSSAMACPECAYPVGTATPPPTRSARSRPAHRSWWRTALPLVARVAIGGFLAAAGVEEDSVSAMIGALIIGGSAIPAWYRDKIERLKSGKSGPLSVDRLNERLAELEDRHREQLVQLERSHSAQITELEERVDFAERLLTERREQLGPS